MTIMARIYRTYEGALTLFDTPDGFEPKPEWFEGAYRGLRKIILGTSPLFPCYFASIAERHGSCTYSFLKRGEELDPNVLYKIIEDFLLVAKDLRPFPVLALFVQTEGITKSLEEDEILFWEIINNINKTRTDSRSAAEANPSSPHWLLKYKDIPIFVTGHSPYYKNRLSRFADQCLTLVIQEKKNLKRISEDPNRIREVMGQIREFVDEYDTIPRCPLLGFYGNENVFDWKQFWLPDSNDIEDTPCRVRPRE